MSELRDGWDRYQDGRQKVPHLGTMCEHGDHRVCGGWFCTCDCHSDDLGEYVPIADHIDHEWEHVAPCVYCCGQRLYQGGMPKGRDERAAMAAFLDGLHEQARAEWTEMRRRVAEAS